MPRTPDERLIAPVKDAASRTTDAQGLALYECGPLRFTGTDNYERHVVFDHAISLADAGDRERFEAVSRSLRDLLTQRWLLTEETYERAKARLLSVRGIPDRPHAD